MIAVNNSHIEDIQQLKQAQTSDSASWNQTSQSARQSNLEAPRYLPFRHKICVHPFFSLNRNILGSVAHPRFHSHKPSSHLAAQGIATCHPLSSEDRKIGRYFPVSASDPLLHGGLGSDIIHRERVSLLATQNGRHQILCLPTVNDCCCCHAEKYSRLCRGGAVLGTGGRTGTVVRLSSPNENLATNKSN